MGGSVPHGPELDSVLDEPLRISSHRHRAAPADPPARSTVRRALSHQKGRAEAAERILDGDWMNCRALPVGATSLGNILGAVGVSLAYPDSSQRLQAIVGASGMVVHTHWGRGVRRLARKRRGMMQRGPVWAETHGWASGSGAFGHKSYDKAPEVSDPVDVR